MVIIVRFLVFCFSFLFVSPSSDCYYFSYFCVSVFIIFSYTFCVCVSLSLVFFLFVLFLLLFIFLLLGGALSSAVWASAKRNVSSVLVFVLLVSLSGAPLIFVLFRLFSSSCYSIGFVIVLFVCSCFLIFFCFSSF